jgi:hypothetical protein
VFPVNASLGVCIPCVRVVISLQFGALLQMLSLALLSTAASDHIPELLELYGRVERQDFTAIEAYLKLLRRPGGILSCVPNMTDPGHLEAIWCERLARNFTGPGAAASPTP